jgi:hypothetical protein
MARFEEEMQMSYVTSFERIAEKRGVEQGKVSGRAELLLKLLALKFGEIPPEIESKVSHAELEQLDRWAERVLAATSLEEIFD